MTDNQDDAREIALQILMDITEAGNFSHTVLSRALNRYQYLTKQDRAFITRLCEGTVERLITLDYIINCYSSIKVSKMKPFIRSLLRISVYQIHYMDQIPNSAACNEAVKLAKKRGFRNLSGFVNGVLRSVIRNEKDIIYPDEEKESKLFLSVVYSVPEWLVNQFLEQYDYSAVKKMLDTTFLEKKTTIRCNLNQITTIELMKMLHAQNVTVEPGAYLPYALKISGYDYLNQLEAFQKGYFQVQDESSMLVGAVSGVKEHDYVIDVCAAPGGKSLHIAELLKSTGKVSSRDVSEKKTSLILENRNRLGYTNLDVTVQDALEFDQESVNRADIVIADLPCSGLGVIGKKPDIKYNMTKEKQLELVNLQRNILSVIQQYVKKDGILLYSTCTINQKENIENVQWFIKHYDFKLESLNPFLPAELQNDTSGEGYLQLVPGIHDTDGFFIARLRKY